MPFFCIKKLPRILIQKLTFCKRRQCAAPAPKGGPPVGVLLRGTLDASNNARPATCPLEAAAARGFSVCDFMPAFDTGACAPFPDGKGGGLGDLSALHDGGKRTAPRGIVRRVCAGRATRVSERARDVRESANSGGAGWDGDVTAAPRRHAVFFYT